MITSKLITKILPLVLKALLPELAPLKKYVEEDNELDIKVRQLEDRIKKIEHGKMPGHCGVCPDAKK